VGQLIILPVWRHCYFRLPARPAGIVASLPHHVTQCGVGRQPIFFEDGADAVYRGPLA
jgi:hypothetical protein